MPNQEAALSQVFSALSAPPRRAVVARLGQGTAPVTELAEPFDMSLPSFTQHLRVLEDCGLVRSRKQGRRRFYGLVPRRLQVVERWLDKQRALWERRLDGLDAHLLDMQLAEQRED